MKGRKGFTLIELMVVIFIVGILAAVAIPIMRGRIDSAKWSEGRAAAGSIRTAARAFCAEKGPTYTYAGTTLTDLGFATGDLEGKYFSEACYSIAWTGYDLYDITVRVATAAEKSEAPTTPASTTLNQDGEWDAVVGP